MSTPDIFISYARHDEPVARLFANALTGEGLNVWWDDDLRSGEAFDQAIEEALRAAKAVIVLWSPDSVRSRWVRAEATLADRNKTIMPVTIAPCERPIIFELMHTADLCGWQGDTKQKAWQDFLHEVLKHVRPDQQAQSPAATLDKKEALPSLNQISIIVLPFLNMSGDAEQEYFADGITEDIITDLSQVSALKVISRNSSFTFKGKSVDVLEISRQLNITHVLEGSVRKAGNRVRVTAQLIDGADNGHVWAKRFDRDLEDIFELQDELSKAIVDALKIRLLPREKKAIAGRGTDNVEAYDLYARARALHTTMGHENARRAIDIYRQAVALDPDFAEAWAGLSNAIQVMGVYEPALFRELWNEGKSAIKRAAELAPDAQDTKVAAALLAGWEYDWDTAAREIDGLGGEAGPIWGSAANVQLFLGRAEDAAKRALRARESDPLSIGTSFGLQYILDAAGRLNEAEAEYERSKDLQGPRVTMEWRALTRALVQNDPERALDIFINRWDGNEHFMPFRERLISVFGQPDQALALLREVFDDPAYQDGSRMAAIANWAVYYGDTDLAFAALRRGIVDQKHFIAQMELWFPMFREMRKDPRFKQLLIDLGIVDHWRRSGNWGDFARPIGADDFEMIA